MDAVQLLRSASTDALRTLEGTMADVTTEQAHWLPAGRAMPIAAHYAHVIFGLDGITNVIRGRTPLAMGDWSGRTGLSELQPTAPPWDEWARRVRVDLAQVREYAHVVSAQVDAYLASLSESDLEAEIEFFGTKMKLANLLFGACVGHVHSHCGEISCLKGLQGARGYPY